MARSVLFFLYEKKNKYTVNNSGQKKFSEKFCAIKWLHIFATDQFRISI